MDIITKSFYDFCIPYINDLNKLKQILRESIELGYKTVAIEQRYDHTKRDTSKKSSDIFPPPIELDDDFLAEFNSKHLKILQRLTITYSEIAITHSMTNSHNLRKYHLIAGVPKTDQALNHCCTTFNGDIISFEPDQKLFVNRKMYQIAVKRGVYFEIKYSPFINCSNYRKDIIKITHNYHVKGKSKNIVISSGAFDRFDLRGPYDVANLALIFGLSEEQGKSAISSNCRLLYLKAESRRLGKTVMILRQYGPIVFSSTDSESEEDTSSESENDELELSEDNAKNEDTKSMESEQPFKKQKLNPSWK